MRLTVSLDLTHTHTRTHTHTHRASQEQKNQHVCNYKSGMWSVSSQQQRSCEPTVTVCGLEKSGSLAVAQSEMSEALEQKSSLQAQSRLEAWKLSGKVACEGVRAKLKNVESGAGRGTLAEA